MLRIFPRTYKAAFQGKPINRTTVTNFLPPGKLRSTRSKNAKNPVNRLTVKTKIARTTFPSTCRCPQPFAWSRTLRRIKFHKPQTVLVNESLLPLTFIAGTSSHVNGRKIYYITILMSQLRPKASYDRIPYPVEANQRYATCVSVPRHCTVGYTNRKVINHWRPLQYVFQKSSLQRPQTRNTFHYRSPRHPL